MIHREATKPAKFILPSRKAEYLRALPATACHTVPVSLREGRCCFFAVPKDPS